ncbi:MAG: class I SAM-dependent methyltransferase [Candidatus Eremiobacteraeota bacterium]|nr:class I SAM-dependent methyltransferase [Candidatus Eremiobacteraeota bacterium]
MLVATDELLRDLEAMHRSPTQLQIELEQRASRDGVPVISHATGRFLATIVVAMQANRILEIGTAYGDATLWMALAQPSVGKIWTIDDRADRTDVARSYFRRAGVNESIEVFNTSPLRMLENFSHRNVDIAFVAAGEDDCMRYLELLVPMLKLSGLAVFNDALTMHGFAQRFLAHPELQATILPFGIGLGARRQ